jgi:hypothetical protein
VATRIALIICAAVHLYGASFYFSDGESYEAYQALLVWFFSVAYANIRALGEEPRLSELVGWSGLPWLLDQFESVAGDPTRPGRLAVAPNDVVRP